MTWASHPKLGLDNGSARFNPEMNAARGRKATDAERTETEETKMNKLLFVIAMILSSTSRGEIYCFESRPNDPTKVNEWSIHHYQIQTPDSSTILPNGIYFRPFTGVGWNEASTPRGSVDIVPFSGSAARDIDGSWIVSINGALWQESQPTLGHPEQSLLFYNITESWRLDATLNGVGIGANLHQPWVSQRFPSATNDFNLRTIERVGCN